MTNKKATKRALIVSVISLMLSFTMLLGTTYAWFTDSVTSTNNIITSGNLDVELYYQNDETTDWVKVTDTTNIFKEGTLWEPGHTEVVKLKVVNEGTLALKYQLGVNVAKEVGSVNVYGKEFKLSDFIKFGIVEGEQSYTRDTAVAAVDATATPLNKAYTSKVTPLESKKENIVTMVVYMPTTVGNDANYAKNAAVPTIDLGLNLYATQVETESDSFGKDYDADAWVDGMVVYTAEDLQAAVANGGTVVLGGNVELTESIVVPESKAATFSMRAAAPATVINLNGYTISANLSKAEGAMIVNNGVLVVNGNANSKLENTAVNGSSVISNNGILQINGGTYVGAPSDTNTGTASYAINTQGEGSELTLNNTNVIGRGVIGATNGTKVVINGGTYHTPAVAWGHAVYANGEGVEVVINDGIFSEGYEMSGNNWGMYQIYSGNKAKVTVNGGTFKEWDCANGYDLCTASNGVIEVYGGTFAEDPSSQNKINYVAEGYVARNNGNGTWTVAMKEGTLNDLFTNVEDNGTVTLPQGTYTIPATVAGKTVTIEGVGDNTVIDFTKVNSVGGASITFKNLHIQGKNENVMNGFGIQSTTGHITYENCTFDGAVTNEYYGSVSYIKCTFTGTGYITTYAVKSAEFVNCTFDKADSRAVLVYSHGDNPCEVTLTDCTFKAAAKATTWAGDWTAAIEVDTTNIPTVGTTVAINNCTYDGNYSGLVRDKSAEGKANAVITVDGKTLLTSDNIKAVTLTSNTGYMLTGDFGGNNVALTMPAGVENVIFDGTGATNINELIVIQNGTLIDNANDVVGERSGNVTVQNFNVLSQINVFACKTEVVVQKNTAEALMIHAGNCDVKVLNNTIDANFESHPTYRNETATWNNNDYGIALNIFEYNLWLDGNTVTDAVGHAIGINGWEGTFDTGVDNIIESFEGNTITVNSTTKTKRAAFKVWDDETYASNDDDTNVVNATAQAFINAVLADGSNTFNIVDGYDHTIFCFYNVNTNE